MMRAREIAKTPILRQIDEFLNVRVNRGPARIAMKDHGVSIASHMAARGLLTLPELSHVLLAWYDVGGRGYWPTYRVDGRTRRAIVRAGFLKALEKAIERDVDIATLWLCAGDHFQAIVTRSNCQVTLLLLTPSIPPLNPPSQEVQKRMTFDEDIVLISTEEDIQELEEAAGKDNNWTTTYRHTDDTEWRVAHRSFQRQLLDEARGIIGVDLYGEEREAYKTGDPDGDPVGS